MVTRFVDQEGRGDPMSRLEDVFLTSEVEIYKTNKKLNSNMILQYTHLMNETRPVIRFKKYVPLRNTNIEALHSVRSKNVYFEVGSFH